MTCAVELPSAPQDVTVNKLLKVIDVEIDVDIVDVASEVGSQISNPIFVSGIDLTEYYLDFLRQEMRDLSPLERFISYRCPREALFANAGSAPPETRPQRKGRSRVGKRKGRRSSMRALNGSVRSTSTSNRS